MRVLPLVLILVKLCTPVWAGGTQSPASQAYAPVRGTCPDNFSLVRKAGDTPSTQTLSADEAKYISGRRSDVLPAAWSAYLANVQATGARLPAYVSDILKGNATNAPTLGIAQSGGGLRAAMVGAGVLSALDGRNTTAQHIGTGGLLQAATYLTALSGGSWLVTSLAQANFPEIQDLVFASGSGGNTFGGWDTDLNVLAPNNISAPYWSVLIEEMSGKFTAGFPVTFIDMWSRAVARHFVNGTTRADLLGNTTLHGAGVTFSSVSELPTFKSHTQPFLIVLFTTNSVHGNSSNEFNGDTLVPVSNPIYEVNVYEMGSYDPLLSAFTPTKYLGTQNSSVCVTGFDQASFMEATSSAFFTVLNTTEALANPNTLLGAIVPILNQTFPQTGIPLDSAVYPNPFKGVAPDMFLDDNEEYLSLVDGGNDAENIPFMPLLVKARGVDVILAIDVTAGSADDSNNNFCNGRSLIATHNRTTFFPSYYSFPTVPLNTSTILAEGLTTRPVFFGCEAKADEPLVIYIANGAPPPGQPAITNFSSLDFDFTPDQAQAIMGQGFTFATQGISNGTVVRDENWPACLACAVTDRARDRSGAAREGVCASCFERYCWGAQGAVTGNGTANSGPAGHSLTLTMTVVLLVLSTIWVFI
ncbi:lysophospholipase catalytic domain-containing protein [Mycena sp. CBHHK59/15]|nr:lysophospholipase catalytic domain-containing protein [Mycena sp. CBHHK59/15]